MKEFSTDTLFGQHLFPTSGKRIVITEGELDAASCYEAMENWPMVSLPHGAAGAKKDLQKQIPLLQGYEEIVLFFDNDEAGRNATEQAASILPLGKVKNCPDWINIKMLQMPYKLMMQMLSAVQYMMQSLINLMASLMGKHYSNK